MNETPRTELELDQDVVELGAAKEVTLGIPALVNTEENAQAPYRIVG